MPETREIPVRKSLLGILEGIQRPAMAQAGETKQRGEGALEDVFTVGPRDTSTRTRGESAIEELSLSLAKGDLVTLVRGESAGEEIL